MFRCYVFAAWKTEDRTAIRYCSRISNFVETPILEQMEMLHKLDVLSETQHVSLNKTSFSTPPQTGTIKSGPLAGFTGTWKMLNGKKMFAVMLNVMGASFEATIDDPTII